MNETNRIIETKLARYQITSFFGLWTVLRLNSRGLGTPLAGGTAYVLTRRARGGYKRSEVITGTPPNFAEWSRVWRSIRVGWESETAARVAIENFEAEIARHGREMTCFGYGQR